MDKDKGRVRESMGETQKNRSGESLAENRSHAGSGEGQRVRQQNILTSLAAAGGRGLGLCSTGMSETWFKGTVHP